MNNNLLQFLAHKALNLRIDSIRATTASKSGHPTSCLSAADVIAAIFFNTLRYDIKNPKAVNNDRFILSKGHAIPVVYAAWKQLGVISDTDLLSLRKFYSVLEGHPTPRFNYNEAATGSLGQGLSVGVGMALNAKHEKLDYTTYVMMGDAEIAEGSVWEAAELAAHYKLNNIVGIVDCNGFGQSGEVMHDHQVEKYAHKFEAFGWKTLVIDGHNLEQIVQALTDISKPLAVRSEFDERIGPHSLSQPTMIIAKTYKGYGISEAQNKNGYHGKPFKEEELATVIASLRTTFKDADAYQGSTAYTPPLPTKTSVTLTQDKIVLDLAQDIHTALFDKDKKMATRQAYGYALAALGRASKDIFVLDGDVKNSTYGEIFEHVFPERFVQCFVAEQNMVGVSTGLESRGKIPFAATFAAFFTRAHDQIRMAGIGRNALRLCGSHVGVSIGEDGPSQMGLEDIALFRGVPESVVLYPSDAVSTYKLTELMANYSNGVSYLRTTRAATPMLYDKNETFTIGGCKILKQSNHDKACVIAAGITLHEALKAHKILQAKGIDVSVIDVYSVKPLDTETIKKIATSSGNNIITIEDHYPEGGIGEAIMHAVANNDFTIKTLAINQLSRSGTPEELVKHAHIDAESIVAMVLSLT